MRQISIQRIFVFLILIFGGTPSIAYAHGIETAARYIGLSALIFGLVGGFICGIRKSKVDSFLLPVFGFYLLILFISAFFLSGEIRLRDILEIVVGTVLFGIMFGFFPLLIGMLAMNYGLNYFSKVFNWRR